MSNGADLGVGQGAARLAEMQALLFREARLLDGREYSAWLTLYSDDCLYWVPSNPDATSTDAVSIVFDDRERLEERVWRLESGQAHAQEPPSRTVRMVTNVEILSQISNIVTVEASGCVIEWRRQAQRVYGARYSYKIRQTEGELIITSKRVDLVNSEGLFGNLSFLL